MLSFKQFLLENKSNKILVISVGTHLNKIRSILTDNFNNVTFCAWSDVIITEKDILINNEPIRNFAFILIGPTGAHSNFEVADQISKYVEAHSIPNFKYGKPNKKKIAQTVKLTDNLAQTMIVDSTKLDVNALVSKLGLPLIGKIPAASKGRGVKKLTSKTDIIAYQKEHPGKLIFQSFIDSEDDVTYRLVFVKNKFIYAITRTKTDKEELDNKSSPEKEELVEVPPEAVVIAKKAHLEMKLDISGVDMMKDKKTSKWYVIEVNAGPSVKGEGQTEPVMAEIVKIIWSALSKKD